MTTTLSPVEEREIGFYERQRLLERACAQKHRPVPRHTLPSISTLEEQDWPSQEASTLLQHPTPICLRCGQRGHITLQCTNKSLTTSGRRRLRTRIAKELADIFMSKRIAGLPLGLWWKDYGMPKYEYLSIGRATREQMPRQERAHYTANCDRYFVACGEIGLRQLRESLGSDRDPDGDVVDGVFVALDVDGLDEWHRINQVGISTIDTRTLSRLVSPSQALSTHSYARVTTSRNVRKKSRRFPSEDTV